MTAKRSAIWKVSAGTFAAIIRDSKTVREVLDHFGLRAAGGNYGTVWARVDSDGLDASHFADGANAARRTASQRKVSLEEVLVENSTYSRRSLKRRLIQGGMLKNECALCGQGPEWRGAKLVLVLDHINGINDDARIENLRLLCPNCNSQTDTFAGRNRRT